MDIKKLYTFSLFFSSEINKIRLQSAQDLARQVEAEVKERTYEHQPKVTELETQLSQLSLMHSEELEKVVVQHREQLRQMEETVSVFITEGLYTCYKRALVKIVAKGWHQALSYGKEVVVML